MALKIIDARQSGFPHDGSFGRAHLVFDREIDAARLKLSLFKLLGQDFLGKSSPPKASWGPRAHFFNAKLIARGNGQSVYRLGPEVTTFILPETVLEVASEDNSIRERAVWSDISVDFGWSGEAVDDEDGPVTTIEAAVEQPKVEQPQVEKPKVEKPKVEPPKVEKPDPPEPLEQVTGGLTTTTLLPQTAPVTPPPPVNWLLRSLIAAAIVLLAGAAYAAYWTSQNRDLVCERHGWFCDPEVVAFRSAQSCAASKTCGAGACVTNYRNAYPNGRFRAQVDDIAVSKGMPCPEPQRDDPEKRAYERVTTCAASKTCGASTCVTEYRQLFPNGAHKAEVDQIMAQKGAICVDATEKEVYDQAVGCARPRVCGALECLAEYRRRYPNGSYKVQIDQLSQAQNARMACPDPVEEDVFERAANCARSKSCGADECLGEYRRRYPNGRHKAEIEQIAQSPKAQACPDLDKEAFDRATRCAASLGCGADHCLIEYRRDFANGKYRSQIEQIGAQKGATCVVQPSPSPTASASPSTDPPAIVPRGNIYPGFSCSRGNLEPIEQMICKDGDMARANDDLQQTYNTKRSQLPRGSANEQAFVDRGKEWVRERNQQCNIPESGSWNDMDLRRLKYCFLDKTRARINELR